MNMENEFAIALGTLIAVIACVFCLVVVVENHNTDKTNEQLKQEKYELKQKLDKSEEKRLECLVGIGE